jgi:hypothetical protein
MRVLALPVLLAAIVLPSEASTQPADRPERGVYLTVFRSPATGLEVRAGHAAAFLGLYPTVIGRDGARGTATFVRAGGTFYLKARGASPYVSPSLVWSLDDRWRNGALTEVGFRGRLLGRVNGRLGAAVLTTLDRQVRVNPTVGLDLRLGARR